MCFDFVGGGGGGSCKFRIGFREGHVNSVLIWGGHVNSAWAWPPFSGPPQHFSNEHSLNYFRVLIIQNARFFLLFFVVISIDFN